MPKGYHHSPEAKAKISAGHKKTPICVICLNCGERFDIRPSRPKQARGKYCSKECYWESLKGRKQSEETRTKRSASLTGIVKTPSWRERLSASHKGKSVSDDTKKRLSESHMGKNGPLASNWKGGISFEPYCIKFTKELKEEVREAFGRKCFVCGMPENGKKLCVHHVDYNKSQGCKGLKWSLIPLCNACHLRTNNYRWHWFALLRDYWMHEYIDFNNDRWI